MYSFGMGKHRLSLDHHGQLLYSLKLMYFFVYMFIYYMLIFKVVLVSYLSVS